MSQFIVLPMGCPVVLASFPGKKKSFFFFPFYWLPLLRICRQAKRFANPDEEDLHTEWQPSHEIMEPKGCKRHLRGRITQTAIQTLRRIKRMSNGKKSKKERHSFWKQISAFTLVQCLWTAFFICHHFLSNLPVVCDTMCLHGQK